MKRYEVASTKGWRGLGRRVTVVLGIYLTSGIGACADLPTASVPQARPVVGPSISIQKPFPQGRGLVQAVCITSEATPDGPFAYEYGRVTVSLPASAVAPNGATTSYRYRGYAGEQVVLAGNCRIPDSEMAVARMNRLFGRAEDPTRRNDSDDAGLQAEAGHTLDGLEVNACQYGGEWPNCQEKSSTWIISLKDAASCTDIACDTGVDPLGGGGGPNPPAVPEEDEGPLAWIACIGAGLTLVGGGTLTHVTLEQYYSAVSEYGSAKLRYDYNPTFANFDAMVDAQENVNLMTVAAAGSATVTVGALLGVVALCSPSVLLPTP